MDDVDDRAQLEQLACDVRGRAVTHRSEMQLSRVLLRHGDDVGDGFNRRAGIGGDQLRHADDQAYRRKIALDVVIHLVEQWIDGVRGEREEEGVAIGRRLCHRVGAEHAARAAAVIDDHGLAEALAQPALQDARNHVRAAAGRIGHDEAHRFRRPVVRDSDARGKQSSHKEGDLTHIVLLGFAGEQLELHAERRLHPAVLGFNLWKQLACLIGVGAARRRFDIRAVAAQHARTDVGATRLE